MVRDITGQGKAFKTDLGSILVIPAPQQITQFYLLSDL